MTRIAFLGDVHGDLGWILAAHRAAIRAGATLLIQVGDFGAEWPGFHKTKMADRLQRQVAQLGLPIAFIRGNHDNVDAFFPLKIEPEGWARLREDIFYIADSARLIWEGISIGGLGGATSRDIQWCLSDESKGRGRRKPRTLYWPEERVAEQAAERLNTGGNLDILSPTKPP